MLWFVVLNRDLFGQDEVIKKYDDVEDYQVCDEVVMVGSHHPN